MKWTKQEREEIFQDIVPESVREMTRLIKESILGRPSLLPSGPTTCVSSPPVGAGNARRAASGETGHEKR